MRTPQPGRRLQSTRLARTSGTTIESCPRCRSFGQDTAAVVDGDVHVAANGRARIGEAVEGLQTGDENARLTSEGARLHEVHARQRAGVETRSQQRQIRRGDRHADECIRAVMAQRTRPEHEGRRIHLLHDAVEGVVAFHVPIVASTFAGVGDAEDPHIDLRVLGLDDNAGSSTKPFPPVPPLP